MITFQLWLNKCNRHRRHKVLQKTMLFHIFQFQFIEFREEAPMKNCKRKYAGRIFVSNNQLTKKNDQQGETDFKITTNIPVHM